MAEEDIALKRFDIVSRIYTAETTIFWARSHFFMVANAALLGFVLSRMLDLSDKSRFILVAACAVGFLLSVFWYRVLLASQYWTQRWEDICVKLEPDAFGGVEVLRKAHEGKPLSTKRIARRTAFLFCGTWIASIVWIFISWWCLRLG